MASTLLHELGFPHDVIERQLAHGEHNKVSLAYNYSEYLPERRKMMQQWADYLDQLKAGAVRFQTSPPVTVLPATSICGGESARPAGIATCTVR